MVDRWTAAPGELPEDDYASIDEWLDRQREMVEQGRIEELREALSSEDSGLDWESLLARATEEGEDNA